MPQTNSHMTMDRDHSDRMQYDQLFSTNWRKIEAVCHPAIDSLIQTHGRMFENSHTATFSVYADCRSGDVYDRLMITEIRQGKDITNLFHRDATAETWPEAQAGDVTIYGRFNRISHSRLAVEYRIYY